MLPSRVLAPVLDPAGQISGGEGCRAYVLRLVSKAQQEHGCDNSVPQPFIATMQETNQALPGIDILNTGYGDFELRFDPNKPDEVQKAKETITDMLKRGYAIFVHQGKETLRVRKFDADRNVYIIGSTPAEEVPVTEVKATAVGRSAGG